MATVGIAFGDPVMGGTIDFSQPASAQVIVTTASNAQSTAAATRTGQVVVISVSGSSVYASIGPAPNALTDPGRRVLVGGSVTALGAVQAGNLVALADV